MEASPPVVRAREIPFENADLDLRVLRRSNIVTELRKVIADASQACFETARLVLVIVNAKDVEVLAGKVNDLLAPDHVIRALLAAGNDARTRSDLAQPAAVNVDDLGVRLRREAVVHGLIVDLEVADPVGLAVAVRCAQLAPFRRWRVVQVMDPVRGVLNLLGADAGRRQNDQRLAAKLPAQSQELVRPKAVVVRVAAPER